MTRLLDNIAARAALPVARHCAAILLLLLAPTAAHAQRDLTDIPLPDPEVELQSFRVAEGFEVNLFAADPQIAKPIQMSFDPQGRLWIVSSEIYPHILPGQVANDKVLVLEDTDGDGTADVTTVFADGLLIPTGVEPGDGGAYVANSTELVHFRDTDGDGRADDKRVVLSGFGTEDTHHILHTLRWGPEGLLYFNQSIYIHSHIETPHGVRRLNGGGVWHFRPETYELDVFIYGLCNPWGHHFDRWGQSFGTDGAGGEGINYFFPGGLYFTSPGAPRTIEGLNPGSPKHCGLEVVSGRHLPDDWQGNLITNDFRAHRVCRFVLSEEGSAYASVQQPELITSDNVAFRPVDVKMGPDGAIYIADWYNPIIQHGEVDFRDPRRDQTHGRIWRVTAKGRPLVPRPKLVDATTPELLEHLRAPEDWTRHQAKRVLKERGEEVLPELQRWLASIEGQDADAEHLRLEGLWVYQALDVVEPELLSRLLTSSDHRVRAAATRVVYHWQARLPDPLQLLARQVADEHPRVRLEAVRALSRLDTPRAIELAASILEQPMDRFLDHALWQTARDLQRIWVPAFARGEVDFGGKVRQMVFVLEAAESPEVVPALVRMIDEGKIPSDQEHEVFSLVARLGGPAELDLIYERVLRDDAPPARRAIVLDALAQAAERRSVRPSGDLLRIAPLLSADDEGLRGAAARLAGRWELADLTPQLIELAQSAETSDRLRQAALQGLVHLPSDETIAALRDLAGPRQAARVRMMAIGTLANLDLATAAQMAVDLLADSPERFDPTGLFATFFDRQEGPDALTAALAQRQLPEDAAKVGLRVARSRGLDAPELLEALQQAGGLHGRSIELTPELLSELVNRVATEGDPARGELVFRRTEQACLKCHAIGGAGGQVGPDLASIGASAQVDYLIESLLLPDKAVKENYHSVVVSTDEGRIFTGVKVRETDRDLILRNAEDEEVQIQLDSIDEQAPGPSIMPAGLVDDLTRGELIDLVRFLSELGKQGPYAIGQAPVMRRWQQLEATPEATHLLVRTSYDSASGDDPALTWSPVYSTVGGVLPVAGLPQLRVRGEHPPVSFVRGEIEVTSPGMVRIALNSWQGVSIWVDNEPHAPDGDLTVELDRGRHRVTLAVQERTEPLRLEIQVPDGANSRAVPLGGK